MANHFGAKDFQIIPVDTFDQYEPDRVENFAFWFRFAAPFVQIGKEVFEPKLQRMKTDNYQVDETQYGIPPLYRSGIKVRGRKGDFDLTAGFQFRPGYARLLRELVQRQQRWVAASSRAYRSETLTLKSRLALGLGIDTAYETGMLLHHTYGMPYLPASAIKGVCRHWVLENCFGPPEQAERAAVKNAAFVALFGADSSAYDQRAHRGLVSFHDAFPQGSPKVEVDIMNPHYPKYYGEGKAPVDHDSPNPIPFLTLGRRSEEGEPQRFALYVSASRNPPLRELPGHPALIEETDLTDESTLLDLAMHWVERALTEHGIGAKTALGYGLFWKD